MTPAVLLLLLVAGPQDPETLREWVRGLGDDDPEVRVRSERNLTRSGPPSRALLERHVDDPDPERRARVRRILGVLGLVEETRFLTGAAVEDRARELEALGPGALDRLKRTPDPRFVPALTDIVLFDLDRERRDDAVEALLAVGTPKIYPALLWALRFPSDRSERAAVWLAVHGDLTLVAELERMGRAKMMGGMVVLGAIRERYPGRKPLKPVEWKPVDAAPILFAAERGFTPAQRARGLRAIATGLSTDVRGLRILRSALADRNEELRFRAAEAFSKLSWGEAVEELAARLSDPNESPRVRRMSARALARNGSMAAKTALLESLNSGSVEARVAAADALGSSRDVTLVEAILKALDGQEEMRVAEALRRAVRSLRAFRE